MFFVVEGNFVGKQRPRFSNGHAYTPAKTKEYEERVIEACKKVCTKAIEGSVYVGIIAYYEIPKSWSKKKKIEAIKGEIQPTVKPDVDNIAKTILDALNGLAYTDDKQVIQVAVRKEYAEQPRVAVVVEKWSRNESIANE